MSKHSEVDKFNVETGRSLMFFRAQRGLTRKQVYEELGVSKSRYTHFENGDFCISFYHILMLCGLFKIDMVTLLRKSKE